tara:strand:- start:162508 stop:164220 length:1713 start_codon:yes stop_codon:yes gene_type:complete
MRRRASLILIFLVTVTALAGAVWRYGYLQGMDQLSARGQADLALASDRLVGQLQRYRDLAVIMAEHPVVQAELAGRSDPGAVAVLQAVADKATALDVLVVGPDGWIKVAAQGALRRDLSGQRHVRRALDAGALGWGHGPAEPLTRRAFFHAAPVFGAAGQVVGAVVVVTDLNGIDYNWRGSNPAAFFTDAGGTVYISNRSELLFWRALDRAAGLVPAGEVDVRDFDSQNIGRHEVWHLGWGPYLPQRALHLTRDLPVIGMTGHVLLDVAQTRRLAQAQAAAVAALCLAFGSLLFLAAERRRALAQANQQLEERVTRRTAALRRAQADLVQAGKLSALGQMSAGISHELNQPLMAIRSFAENAVQFMERDNPERATENLARISDMARRMGRIIQNLRAFARQESNPQGRVDLAAALQSAIDLTQAHVAEAGVALHYDPAAAPIWVRGGEVRLGQVFVNLITNAVDAMAASAEKELSIDIEQGGKLVVNVRDSGPGIEMPDKVFDPFYTTKSVGSTLNKTGGMGLGLSISYGIVQSFGGQIRGSNRPEGGALFSVTLERAAEGPESTEGTRA